MHERQVEDERLGSMQDSHYHTSVTPLPPSIPEFPHMDHDTPTPGTSEIRSMDQDPPHHHHFVHCPPIHP